MMDNIRDESGEFICRCGNTITDQGFWPCDIHGKIKGDAWHTPYRVCAKCGRVMDAEGNVLVEPWHPRGKKATV
jgi:hypothetical protein